MTSIAVTTQEYLRTINPLAQKIFEDVEAAKDAYQDLWDSLDYAQQQQVLDEAIIDPSVVLKYSAIADQKINWNEDFKSNFSWFTKSQLNLFTNLKHNKTKKAEPVSPIPIKISTTDTTISEGNKKTHSDSSNLLNKLKNKVNNLKTSSVQEEKMNLVDKVQKNIVAKGVVSKPKTPPPPPPSRYSGSEHTEKSALLAEDAISDHGDEIPKTGFDFLDNW